MAFWIAVNVALSVVISLSPGADYAFRGQFGCFPIACIAKSTLFNTGMTRRQEVDSAVERPSPRPLQTSVVRVLVFRLVEIVGVHVVPDLVAKTIQ